MWIKLIIILASYMLVIIDPHTLLPGVLFYIAENNDDDHKKNSASFIVALFIIATVAISV